MSPIVAYPSGEMHRFINIIDDLVKPILQHIASFIRDYLDLLHHLSNKTRKESLLVSFMY